MSIASAPHYLTIPSESQWVGEKIDGNDKAHCQISRQWAAWYMNLMQ